MLSAPSSSTQSSGESSFPLSSNRETPDPVQVDTIVSYRDLSGPEIFQQLRALQSDGIHYAADKDIISQCEFVFNRDVKGDILVPKETESPLSEFVLTGIFQIDARNFFLTSDGKWNSNNPLGTHFDQVKPSCHLLPVQRDHDFIFSSTDFLTIVSNLRAIESLANTRKTHDNLSVIIGDAGQSSAIKLTHHLFVVRYTFPLPSLFFISF